MTRLIFQLYICVCLYLYEYWYPWRQNRMRTLGDVELEIGTGKQQQELGVGKWTQEALMIDFQHNPKREE